MTYSRVDEKDQECFEGYSYKNMDGDLEYVRVEKHCVVIRDSSKETVTIYEKDIKNLIKALKKAAKKCAKEDV